MNVGGKKSWTWTISKGNPVEYPPQALTVMIHEAEVEKILRFPHFGGHAKTNDRRRMKLLLWINKRGIEAESPAFCFWLIFNPSQVSMIRHHEAIHEESPITHTNAGKPCVVPRRKSGAQSWLPVTRTRVVSEPTWQRVWHEGFMTAGAVIK